MIPWINFTAMIILAILTTALYIRSVSPAALEQKIGAEAYRRCRIYRVISGSLFGLFYVSYVLYLRYPLPLPLPTQFPWAYWISAAIGILIGVPSVWLMVRGLLDAGEETIFPRKAHTMHSGIYEHIRHPQSAGELPSMWALAFLLNSPHLVLINFIWVPIFIWMVRAEEKDLLLRFGEAYTKYQKQTGAVFPRGWLRKF